MQKPYSYSVSSFRFSKSTFTFVTGLLNLCLCIVSFRHRQFFQEILKQWRSSRGWVGSRTWGWDPALLPDPSPGHQIAKSGNPFSPPSSHPEMPPSRLLLTLSEMTQSCRPIRTAAAVPGVRGKIYSCPKVVQQQPQAFTGYNWPVSSSALLDCADNHSIFLNNYLLFSSSVVCSPYERPLPPDILYS